MVSLPQHSHLINLISTEIRGCSSQPCLNQGTCIDLANGYQCQCHDGFYGINCQHGKLYFHRFHFKLVVNKSSVPHIMYIASLCVAITILIYYHLTDINECESSPCLNDGTCTEGVNTFACVCTLGFIGVTCDTGKLIC